MRRRRGFVPGAWARLEERVVLSTGLTAEVGPSMAVAPHVRLDLQGTVTGVAFRRATDTWQLSGSGIVAPLGQVRASGTLTIRTTPPLAGGLPVYDGHLTLEAARGKVFVHIYSDVRGPGPYKPHPVALRYDITGGTGGYLGATGHGAATYDQTPPAPFPPGPWGPPQARFTLSFGDVPRPVA